MISLTEAQNRLVDLCPDFISFAATDLVLTEWANKGVVSGIEIRGESVLYPKIIVIEILTAVNLKKEYNYKLREIAEARKYLNLSLDNLAEAEENNLLNFINLERIHNDKKLVIKKALQKINSIKTMKNIIDELYQENKKLETIADYSVEFFKAKREVQKINPELIN